VLGKQGYKIVLLSKYAGLPFSILCYFYGVTSVSASQFLMGVAGMFPMLLGHSYVGGML